MSGYRSRIDHTLDRLGMLPHGHTFDLLDEADLDRYVKRIAEEGVEAVVRTATGSFLIATHPGKNGGSPRLSNPTDWDRGPSCNYFNPEDRDELTLPSYCFPMIIVHGPSLLTKLMASEREDG